MTATVRVGIRVIQPANLPFTLNAATGIFTFSGKAAGLAKVSFPQISMVAVHSGASDYTQTLANRMAKAHLVILGAYAGVGTIVYGGGGSSSMFNFVNYINSQSVIGTKVFPHYIPDTVDGSYPDMEAIINTNNWNLYKVGSSGTKTPNYDTNPSHTMTNMSTYTPAVGGFHVGDRATKYWLDYMINGTQGGTYQAVDKASNLAGMFWDGCATRTTAGGRTAVSGTYAADWNRDGVSDYQNQVGPPSGATIDQAYRDGTALGLNYIRNNSSKLVIGNMADWGYATGANATGNYFSMSTTPTGMSQLLHGGLIEFLFGATFSNETFGGHALAKTMYQYCMANSDPNTQLVQVQHVSLNGYDNVQKTGAAYQCTRCVQCFTLMDNGGYNAVTATDNTFSNYYTDPQHWQWFDEYCVNTSNRHCLIESTGSTGYGYLGAPQDAAWPAALTGLTSSTGNGLFIRRFRNSLGQNWVVIYNPRGNGVQTFNFNAKYGTHLNKLLGVLETTVNNGATNVSVIVLQDRDGLIAQEVP